MPAKTQANQTALGIKAQTRMPPQRQKNPNRKCHCETAKKLSAAGNYSAA
jgi:hypothetical protein